MLFGSLTIGLIGAGITRLAVRVLWKNEYEPRCNEPHVSWTLYCASAGAGMGAATGAYISHLMMDSMKISK